MVKKLYTESYIQNIADAIRTVNGKTTKYYVRQMADAILDLGTAGDSILDNSASDAVVDLETNITTLSDYKMYRANKLETVKGLNLDAIGEYALASSGSLYSVEVADEPLNLYQYSLASDSHLYKIIRGIYEYVGSVTTIPFSSVHVMRNTHGGTVVYDDISDYEFRNGHLIFNEADSKTYVYNNGSWEAFIPDKNTRVGPYVFNGSSRLECFPYKLKGCNPPTNAQASYNNMFRGCGLRNIYINADDFDPYERPHMSARLFEDSSNLEMVWMVYNGTLSDDISLVFTSLGDYCFHNCTKLKSITLTNVTALGSYALGNTRLTEIIAPKVTSVGTGAVQKNANVVEIVLGALASLGGYMCTENPKLEKFTFGNGTNTPSSTNITTMFRDNPMLWYFEMNTAAVVPLTGNILTTFQNSPLVNFMGTTTTEITEGSTVTSVVIDGTTKTAANNNIVSYGGKDWILTSGAWTEWGTNGNKHPIIKVPSALISSYQSHAQWSKFSPEIWQAI